MEDMHLAFGPTQPQPVHPGFTASLDCGRPRCVSPNRMLLSQSVLDGKGSPSPQVQRPCTSRGVKGQHSTVCFPCNAHRAAACVAHVRMQLLATAVQVMHHTAGQIPYLATYMHRHNPCMQASTCLHPGPHEVLASPPLMQAV